MLLLIINSYRQNKRYTRTLTPIFTAALIGDVFLIGDYIISGLLSFLVAHLFLLMYLSSRFSSEMITITLILNCLISYGMIRNMGLVIPEKIFFGVWLYGTVLLTNFLYSFLQARKVKYQLLPLAMFFLISSDIMIGYELFGNLSIDPSYLCMMIISSYWLGMILLSLINSPQMIREEPYFDYSNDSIIISNP